METFTQPKITGYRQLNDAEAAMMNRIKELGNQVGGLVSELKGASDELGGPDGRWVAIATTQLQQGFMALTRAVAKPTSF